MGCCSEFKLSQAIPGRVTMIKQVGRAPKALSVDRPSVSDLQHKMMVYVKWIDLLKKKPELFNLNLDHPIKYKFHNI